MTTGWTENWTTVQLLGAAAGLFLVYYVLCFTKLRRCGIPGPLPLPLFGTILTQLTMGFHSADEYWTKKYGRIVGLYNGSRLLVLVTDPDLLKRVFVKDFYAFTNRQVNIPLPKLFKDGLFFIQDDHWRMTRNIMSPTFSGVKLRQMIDLMNGCAETLSNNLVEEAKTSESKSIKDNLGAFSLDVISSTAFGLEIDSQNQPNNPLVQHVRSVFDSSDTRQSYRFVLANVVPGFVKLATLLPFGPLDKAVNYLGAVGQAVIADRKTNQSERVDFLQLLINAEYQEEKQEDAANGHKAVSNGTKANGHQSTTTHRLTDDSINAQMLLFFLAGYETTSSLLRYATYVLATRPDIDERIVDEIKEVLGDEEPTYDGIGKLKYMEMFINETLRFYPPIPRLSRVASQDIRFGDMLIPKGTEIAIPCQMIHHDPEFYPDPEVFDPERFSPENKARINPVTFIPFGYGPRNCIGMRLALVEAKLALVHMLRRLRFVRTPDTQVPLKFKKTGLLVPLTPIKIGLTLRE